MNPVTSNKWANALNGGLACLDEYGGIYFSDFAQKKLIKYDMTLREQYERLDFDVCEINVYGCYIYYLNPVDNRNLYRCDLGGSNIIKISNDSCEDLIIINDFLYFINLSQSNRIYKMRVDGAQRECISNDSAGNLYFEDDSELLYYCNLSENDTLYSINLNGFERGCVLKKKVGFPNVVMDILYFSDGNNNGFLTEYDLSTGELKVLESSKCENINANYFGVYYSNCSEGNNLKVYNRLNQEITIISDKSCEFTSILDKYIISYNRPTNSILMFQADRVSS